jgi:thiosulfate dehydrogenase
MFTRVNTYLSIATVLCLAVAMLPAHASADPLADSVQHGKQLFTSAHFNGNGRTCNTCHRGEGRTAGMLPNGKTIPSLSNAAAIFPRYNKNAGKVITLQQQVHRCIMGALQGTPPAYDSQEMTDLVSYLTSLSEGKSIAMGTAPQ